MPPAEQVKGEVFKHGDRIKCFVVDVKQGEKGPEVTLSRTHPAFVKMLFALEVPEIKDRVVDIVGIAREPGARTKLSVRTHRAGVSAKGALIGPQGSRAQNVMNELNGEKIDIIDYSDDPAAYVANALAPAKVSSVEALKAVNRELMALYWNIGELIVTRQESAGWGKSVVEQLAQDLQVEFHGMAGFSARNIWNMRNFYVTYRTKEKLQPMVAEIGWTHNLVILESKDRTIVEYALR